MLTISKPLSPVRREHTMRGSFRAGTELLEPRPARHTRMAGQAHRAMGLHGAVGSEHFARLSEGQHPRTEEQLVRHQVSRTYEGKFGREVTSAEHRAGWDATFSAPSRYRSPRLWAAMSGCGRRIEKVYAWRFGNLSDTRRRGSAMSMPRNATGIHRRHLSSTITARPVDGYAAPAASYSMAVSSM